MNQFSTLHQLVSRPSEWSSIAQIKAAWQTTDSFMLLGEAAQGYQDSRIESFKCIYILQADASLLNLTYSEKDSTQLSIIQLPSIQVISFDEWAELILKHDKHISWR